MTKANSIKDLRETEDKSISEIAKIYNINWRTAKKYADGQIIPKVKQFKERKGMMYDEKWGEIVSLWLTEDARLPKKQRRNNTNFYLALKEAGFPGSYRTVCNFVNDWKKNHLNEPNVKDKGSERLEHPAGEAQLDFGTMMVEYQGEMVKIKVLILSFPFSNNCFVVALPSENQECLLEGMKQLFKLAGGVPKIIRVDNMSTAVISSKKRTKQAKLTPEFQNFASYYRFKVQTCNVRSGNEKGNVENKVGYVRYHFFVEGPRLKNFDLLNRQLTKKFREDRQRKHYRKGKTIEELWESETLYLKQLPEEEYPVFAQKIVRPNKYNEIKIDGQAIHVHKARNYGEFNLVQTAYRYKLYDIHNKLVKEGLRPYLTDRQPIEWPLVIETWLEKPRSMRYSRYWKYLPEKLQTYLSVTDWQQQIDCLHQLDNWLRTYKIQEIAENLESLSTKSTTDNQNAQHQLEKYDALTRLIQQTKEVKTNE